MVFYSPRTEFRLRDILQAFKAIGRITGEESYQVNTSPDFYTWRESVEFFKGHESAIAPLIQKLDFIRNQDKWVYPSHRGQFEVGRSDFERIAKAINARLALAPGEKSS